MTIITKCVEFNRFFHKQSGQIGRLILTIILALTLTTMFSYILIDWLFSSSNLPPLIDVQRCSWTAHSKSLSQSLSQSSVHIHFQNWAQNARSLSGQAWIYRWCIAAAAAGECAKITSPSLAINQFFLQNKAELERNQLAVCGPTTTTGRWLWRRPTSLNLSIVYIWFARQEETKKKKKHLEMGGGGRDCLSFSLFSISGKSHPSPLIYLFNEKKKKKREIV